MNWLSLIKIAVLAALSANRKTAPIADEVSNAVGEAETLFTVPGSGASKLTHVLNIAREAAQATDELRGGEDEVAGHVTVAVNASIAAANALVAAVKNDPSQGAQGVQTSQKV